MSNTAEVSPYQPVGSAAGAALSAAASYTAAAVSELIEALAMTESEHDIAKRYREMQRKDRLAAARINLCAGNAHGLLAAARAIGFTPVRPLAAGSLTTAGALELKNANGERLAVHLGRSSATLVSANGDRHIKALVRRQTLDSTRRYMTALGGGTVTIREKPDGVVEFVAVEQKAMSDGRARLTATVAADGVTQLDISDVRGTRCEKILVDFKDAIGGEVTAKAIKPAYYENAAPGEPTRIRAR